MQCAPTTRTLLSKYFMQNVSSSLAYSIMVSPHQPGTRSLGPKPPRPCSQTSHGSPQPRIESNRVWNSVGKTLRLHSGLGPGSHRAQVSPSPSSPARPPLSLSLPAAPFPPPSPLARASSFPRPRLQLPAKCPCLPWTTLGFSAAPAGGGLCMGAHSLRLGWVSLRLDLGPEDPLLVPAPRMPSLFKSWPRRQRVGSRLLVPIFHIMRLRYIVTKLLPQGYAVSQWQSWDRVPKSLAPEPTSRPVRSHCPAKGRQKHGAPTALGSLGAPGSERPRSSRP